MTSIKLMLNKERILKSGKYPLVFQIIHARRKKLIYTDIKLLECEFDSDKEKVCHSKKSQLTYRVIARFNQQVGEVRANIQKNVKQLEAKSQYYTVADIVDGYLGNDHNLNSLILYMEKQVEKKKKMHKNGTAAAYLSTLHSLQSYIGDRKVRFIDIDFPFLDNYQVYLYSKGNSENTVGFYIKNFRAIYNRAKKEGARVVPSNPFLEIDIKTEKTVKRALTKKEIRKIAELDISANSKRNLARDLFMFSFNSRGMPFVDILYLKKQDIIDDVIFYRRSKTNQPLSVTITAEMGRLIRKYQNDSEYVFPILNPDKPTELYNQYRNALKGVNTELKAVAKEAGINVNLTTYVARHTWATVAKETGAPISSISDGLGHTSEKTTQIYLKDFDQSTLHQLNKKVTKL